MLSAVAGILVLEQKTQLKWKPSNDFTQVNKKQKQKQKIYKECESKCVSRREKKWGARSQGGNRSAVTWSRGSGWAL